MSKELRGLYWHCLDCGDHAPVESTGDADEEYKLGDMERCIICGDGTSHVVTLRRGAAFESGLAGGLDKESAWARALTVDAAEQEAANGVK